MLEGRRELPPTILLRRALDVAGGTRIRAVATGRRGSVCLLVKGVDFMLRRQTERSGGL